MDELLKLSTIDFKKKSAREVGKRLSRMKSQAELAKKSGNDKEAFIFLKRWLNTVEWIKTTKDYKDNVPYYDKNFPIKKEHEVRELFAEVEKKCIALYTPKKPEPEFFEDTSDEETRLGGKKSSIDGVLNLPETPTDEPFDKESGDYMSCLQLFQLVKSNNEVLIIDIRSREEYNNSRIKSDRCINLPADVIIKGVLAANYEKHFAQSRTALSLFEMRGCPHTEVIVILDWSTTSSTLFPGNKMRVLSDVLKNWDPGTRVTKIKYLDGGYAEWLNRYPSIVTNPKVTAPDMQTNAMDEILEEVTYPEWANSEESTSSFNALQIVPPLEKNKLKPKSSIDEQNINDITMNSLTNDEISMSIMNNSSLIRNDRKNSTKILTNENDRFERIKHPYNIVNKKITEISRYDLEKMDDRETEDVSVDEDEVMFEIPKLPNESTLYNKISKPQIDRSSKPSSSTTKNRFSDGKKSLLLTNQFNDLLKNLEQLEIEAFSIEMEYHEQDLNDNRDVSKKSKKEYLKERLNELNLTINEVRTKEDLLNETLSQKSIVLESMTLNNAEAHQMSELQLSIQSLKTRLKKILLERKILKEKARKEKMGRLRIPMPKLNDNSITKEPLKSDGSSANTGLKRSHSSPNLAQDLGGNVPLVDRSSKPRTPVANVPNRTSIGAISKLTWKDREQRMDPIFRDTITSRAKITGGTHALFFRGVNFDQ